MMCIMKRAIKEWDNIITFRIDEEWQRYDIETYKAIDYFCQATVHILERMEEWDSLELFDPESNSFLY